MSSGVVDLPNQYSQGLWTLPAAFTPVTSDTSSQSGSNFICYRQGVWLYIDGQVRWFGTGAAIPYTVGMPTAIFGNIQIDPNFLPGGANNGNATASNLGNGDSVWLDVSAGGWRAIWPKYVGSTSFGFWMGTQVLDGSLMSNGESINFRARLPIKGWS